MPYGNLNVDVVQSSTANTPPQFNDGNGTQVGTLCRAWVNFNGTVATPTIRGSFNVTSITKNGTGDYTVNFTNAMTDTNYSVNGTVQYDTSGSTTNHYLMGMEIRNVSNAMQTGSVRVAGMYGGAVTYYDMNVVCVSIFR